MALSVYSTSIPIFIHHLKSLQTILRKGEDHAINHKIDPSVLLNSRLFPDMFALTRQVQIASDTAKGGGARLAGVELPKFEDTETSFTELYARIAKTIDFLRGIKAEQLEGAETRKIQFKDRKTGRFLSSQQTANLITRSIWNKGIWEKEILELLIQAINQNLLKSTKM